jgi:uncharacterized membrane-anchored protein
MSDNVFQWSLIGLTIAVIGWIVGGIVNHVLPTGAVVVIGIVAEIVIGGALLYFWGKGYMERKE